MDIIDVFVRSRPVRQTMNIVRQNYKNPARYHSRHIPFFKAILAIRKTRFLIHFTPINWRLCTQGCGIENNQNRSFNYSTVIECRH